jgi:D-alanine-D-alanine ligase
MVKKAEDLIPAIKFAFSENPAVLVEQGITGRELTCAAFFDGKKVSALPVIEIVSDNEYFDYDAKYNGHSKEICPAGISDEQRTLVQKTTAEIYTRLGCKGIVRMDYILAADGLYFLEVNTIPGMTSASLVPKMIRTAGIDITAFLTTIIENS